jgi:hypothetical protein
MERGLRLILIVRDRFASFIPHPDSRKETLSMLKVLPGGINLKARRIFIPQIQVSGSVKRIHWFY